jgi:hypothetical protein
MILATQTNQIVQTMRVRTTPTGNVMHIRHRLYRTPLTHTATTLPHLHAAPGTPHHASDAGRTPPSKPEALRTLVEQRQRHCSCVLNLTLRNHHPTGTLQS